MNLTKEFTIDQIENKNMLKRKLESMKMGTMLSRNNFRKRGNDGYSIQRLLYRIMVVLFMDKPMRALWQSSTMVADCLKGAGKDCYYRMLKNEYWNWRKLHLSVSMEILKPLAKLSRSCDCVLVLDDTSNKKRGKKIELISKQFDHSTHTYYNGFTQTHLGWNDGHSYVPIDFCVKVSADKRLNTIEKPIDKRTCGAKRRKESFKTKLEQGLDMLRRCYAAGIEVGCVAYDSWFAKPSFIKSVFEIGYHSVCQLVKNDKIWTVQYRGKSWTLKGLYRDLRNKNLFHKMIIGHINQEISSVTVKHANGLELKLVFCRTSHKKEWIVIASSDISMTDYQILEAYAKRWGIEKFFKDIKQLLRFGDEQSTDFDVQIAMTTIRLITYAIASGMHRGLQDERTLGNLFEHIENEFSRLNLDREILELIFKFVTDSLSAFAQTQVMSELKVLFVSLLNNFATTGVSREKRQVA